MNTLTVYVAGLPRGKQRARHVPAGKGKFRVASTTSKAEKLYRAQLVKEIKRQMALAGWAAYSGIVDAEWTAYFATRHQDRWGKRYGQKPDRDNIDKIVMDSAEDAGMFTKGDQQAGDGTLRRRWAKDAGLVAVFTLINDDVYDDDDDEDDDGVLILES